MGVSTITTLKMKVLLSMCLISLSCSQPPTQSTPTCPDCYALVSTLAASLTTQEALSKQVEVLLAKVCPKSSEPEKCQEQLPALWTEIGESLWPNYYKPEAVWMCGGEGVCGGPDARHLTCDGCKAGIRLSIAQLLSDEFINGIIEEISGDEGCGQEKEAEKCRDLQHSCQEYLPALREGERN